MTDINIIQQIKDVLDTSNYIWLYIYLKGQKDPIEFDRDDADMNRIMQVEAHPNYIDIKIENDTYLKRYIIPTQMISYISYVKRV